MSKSFLKVVAVDSSQEMIVVGKRIAEASGAKNIEFINTSADVYIANTTARFTVITFGNSLHWFDRRSMLRNVYDALLDNGYVVIIGVASLWAHAPEPWQRLTLDVIKRYLGETRRTVDGTSPNFSEPYSTSLRAVGFSKVSATDFMFPPRKLSADNVISEQHSTSYASPALFGKQIDSFDQELRRELLKLCPANVFHEERAGSIVTAQKCA